MLPRCLLLLLLPQGGLLLLLLLLVHQESASSRSVGHLLPQDCSSSLTAKLCGRVLWIDVTLSNQPFHWG
jgi:hypothetical protein